MFIALPNILFYSQTLCDMLLSGILTISRKLVSKDNIKDGSSKFRFWFSQCGSVNVGVLSMWLCQCGGCVNVVVSVCWLCQCDGCVNLVVHFRNRYPITN
jgi:hypothetical protein